MIYKLETTFAAKQDVKEAAVWYNNAQSGLGKKFTAQIRDCTEILTLNPLAFALRFENIRMAVVKQFPYIIHYIVDEEKKLITLIAVLHTSLNPEKWMERT